MSTVDERPRTLDLAPEPTAPTAPVEAHTEDTTHPYAPSGTGVRTAKVARTAAAIFTGLIACASFVLSFSSLWDLAGRSTSWPRDLAWLWPLIVDGVVVVATIAIRALSESTDSRDDDLLGSGLPGSGRSAVRRRVGARPRRDRAFFWWMLTAAAVVSVAGNGLHSLLPAGGPLSPWLSVVIGCIPACALLATTHALQRLSRLHGHQPAESAGTDAVAARAAEVAERRAAKWHAVAAAIHERGLLTNHGTETLAAAMVYLFDVKPTPSLRSIATHVGVAHHDVVSRVREAALVVLDDPAARWS